MEEDPAPAPAGSIRFAVLKRRWGLLVAIVVPVVTVATLVIPLVADAGRRVTSPTTLAVGSGTDAPGPAPAAGAPGAGSAGSADVAPASLTARELEGEAVTDQFPDSEWRVPVSAPWDTFPMSSDPGTGSCTGEQIDWLEKNGRRDIADIWNGYLTLNNTATDGSSLSIRNVRSVGAFLAPGSPEVQVHCALGIGGASSIIYLRQDLGTDHPAVYGDDSSGPEGTPATINIAPGQYVQLVVAFDHGTQHVNDDFSGSLVADVVTGDTTTTAVLFQGFTREGAPAITTTSLTIYGNSLECGRKLVDPCSMTEFVGLLKADPGYRG